LTGKIHGSMQPRERERRPGAQADPMFDWNNLRFFLAVARKSRLTGASEVLGVNHTTVGRRIHELEVALKTTLFDKKPAGYILNAAGVRLLDLAENIESACQKLSDTIGGYNNLLAGKVRVSVPQFVGDQFLAPAIGSLYQQCPGIDLELLTGPEALSISKREADLAITLSRPSNGRIVTRRLSHFKLRLYGSVAYLSERTPIRCPQDLRQHMLIEYVDECTAEGDETQGRPHAQGEESDVARIVPAECSPCLRSSSINVVLSTTAEGLGLSVLPCFVAERDPRLCAILPNQLESVRTLWISMHEDHRAVRRVTEVRNWIVKTIENQRESLLGRP
jgi:DNA-binding transcriptional LysR family regulator